MNKYAIDTFGYFDKRFIKKQVFYVTRELAILLLPINLWSIIHVT